MYEMPALDRSSVRFLRDIESVRLRKLHPGLPSIANCVTCQGVGSFRWRDDDGAPADWVCRCEDQFLLHRYLLNAGIEKHYQRLFWADAIGVAPDVLDVVQDYIDHSSAYVSTGVGLLLWGSMGTGKSMLATLLLKSVLKRGIDGYFATFHNMLDLFTAGWQDGDLKCWFDQRVCNAGLLVIDDIGREHGGRNAVAESTLDHVLRNRVAADRPTIITTNRCPSELGILYSDNTLSLLSGSAIQKEFHGADYRSNFMEQKIAEARAGLTRPVTFG